MGVEVELFNPWKRYDWTKVDIIHVFGADIRNYFLLKALPGAVPLVVSPIVDKIYPFWMVRFFIGVSGLLPPQMLTSYHSYKLAFNKADSVVAMSRYEQQLLQKGFGVRSQIIRIVPVGVDEKFLHADSSLFYAKYGLKNFVLYVGQIGNPRKNLLCLLEVAHMLPDVQFVLIGPILETRYAQRVLSSARKLKNVYILGRVAEAELISAYAACKVFVLPSVMEGAGLAALEAGLAGANIVVTERGGTRDYFGEYATFVQPNTRSIYAGIQRALASPGDKRLQSHIAQHFLWPRVVANLLDIYKELV
ncbi:MAG: glycosyltransferase family 4 protein [Thermoproteota archaeon]